MDATAIIRRWLRAINTHSAGSIAALLTQDHVFADSSGAKIQGGDAVTKAWTQYFRLCSGYKISPRDILAQENLVAVFGEAAGKTGKTRWAIQAAWRAEVRDGLVAEWRVFAEHQPVKDVLQDREASQPAASKRFTKRQGDYLIFIYNYMKRYGCAPAESDVARHFMVSGPSAHMMMVTLEKRGLIEREPWAGRSTRLLISADELFAGRDH